MSKKGELLFVSVFLVMIYSVGVVQGLVEKKRGETIQFFDIFKDTFVVPVKRANTIDSLFTELTAKLDTVEMELEKGVQVIAEAKRKQTEQQATLDSLNSRYPDDEGADEEIDSEPVEWDYSTADERAEEALFLAQDIKKNIIKINRHISMDTLATPVVAAEKIVRATDELYNLVYDEEDIPAILKKREKVVAMVREEREKYDPVKAYEIPLLALETFFKHTWMSRKYLRAYEGEIEETSVFANTLRPPMQFVRYTLLHDLGSKAILGKKGWFFYKPGFDYLTYPHIRDKRSLPDTTTNIIDPSPVILRDDPVKEIVTFRDQLAEKGIDLLVVIVPGKPSIYPDLLSDEFGPEMAGKVTHSLDLIKVLRKKDVDVVDLFTPFAEERKRDTLVGDSLYLAKDTHWKSRALLLASDIVAQRVKEYPWYDPGTKEYVVDSLIVERVGDVGTMTTLPDFPLKELRLQFPTEPTKCYQVFEIRRDEEGNEISRRLYRDDYRNSDILLLGDSFSRIYQTDAPRSAGWIAHLAKELSQPLATIVNDGGASTLVRETLSRKRNLLKNKKLVIWEFVERDFRFGAHGWKKVEL
ncbi:MAG: hypothetical protein GF401_12790 [Chitinivibrionales bacterium]|nr:hypothetical protein [Chitinivibrionales bacterium]